MREHDRTLKSGICPSCGSTKLVRESDEGETYCAECGFVMAAPPITGRRELPVGDTGVEGLGFGPPVSIMIPNKGLPSRIGYANIDDSGRPLSNEDTGTERHETYKQMWNRLRKVDRNYQP